MFGSRILVLAPHPDDEIVGFCTSIGRAQAQGANVAVLFLTTGCADKSVLWPWQRSGHDARTARRRAEAQCAAQFLNMEIAGFSSRPARTLWRDLDLAQREIETVVCSRAIDQLWAPAYEGGHADHDALNGLCQTWRERPGVLEFAEYNFANRAKNAQTFPRLDGQETTILLTNEERETKRSALALYASETSNLDYVGLERESFRPLKSADYVNPPHEGTLWCERFHWLPLRHPRVDFTPHLHVRHAVRARLERTSDLLETAKRQDPEHKE